MPELQYGQVLVDVAFAGVCHSQPLEIRGMRGLHFFYNYYVLNQFVDCKVYVAEVDSLSQGELWDFYEFEGHDLYSHLRSERIQMIVVLAEKGTSLTWDRNAYSVSKYRDADIWTPYRTGKRLIQESKRKSLMGHGGLTLQKQRDSRDIRQMLIQLMGRLPDKWKTRIPQMLKSKIIAMLTLFKENKIEGYRYAGRI